MQNNTFSTDSFVLASFLLSESCTLLYLDKTDIRRAKFVFDETPLRQELTELFFSHKALVEPHKFFSAQKDIKQLLYES